MKSLEAVAKPVLIYCQGTVSTVPQDALTLAASAAEGQTSGAKAHGKRLVFSAWLKPCPDGTSKRVLQRFLIQTKPPQGHRKSRGSQGFTLVETIMAIAVLAIGVMSLATLMPYATQNDYRSRMDTTATFIASRQLEQMLAQPYIVTSFTSAADGAGNTANITVSCGAPGCDAGTTLVGGLISFVGAAPAGYGRIYTIPASGIAGAPKVNGGTYDVRWHISQNTNGVRTILIAARPQGNQPGTTTLPANLRAVKMK